jgi:hypothetical protein
LRSPEHGSADAACLLLFDRSLGKEARCERPPGPLVGGNCNETDAYVWMQNFLNACTGCQVDYIAVHTYVCTLAALKNYIQKFETQFKKPIWLTEFSCLDGSLQPTAANQSTYMSQAVPFLESDPMIFRYSWFTGRYNTQPNVNLLGTSGTLTTLGNAYVGLPPPK